MSSAKIVLCLSSILAAHGSARRISQASAQGERIVIAASELLDGRGRVLHKTRIVIEGSKIINIDPKAKPVDYDLRGLTVLPGWIDAHGRNAEEFIDRVRDGGVDPMAAMVSANSLGAEALGMADQIGSIAPGLEADIIALDGTRSKTSPPFGGSHL